MLNRVLTALGLGALAGAGLYRLALGQARSEVDGVVLPPGVTSDVEIVRDRYGVPHLYAMRSRDLYYALGYVHAQDRLWQMELNRRVARGTLAEIFGEPPLLFDRLMRRLGLGRVAEAEVVAAEPDERAVLEAYAAGVNGFLATHRHRLPLEFRILRFRPAPWEPADSLAWGKMISWLLSSNWDSEWFRAKLVEELGAEAAAALDLGYPAGHPLTISPGAAYAGAVDSLLAGFRAVEEDLALLAGGMSNAWAVAPSRSATGGALLASDPHLRPQLPSIWYEAHLCGPDGLDVTGATMPGLPVVLIGHNREIAWGVTASMVDTQDLFVERLDPSDPARYQTPEGWAPLATRVERIVVRGRAEPVVEEVQETRHGPALSPLLPGEPRFLAIQSPLLRPHHSVRGAVALNRARNWEEFRAALADWDLAANFVYADRAGNVGYQLSGLVPRRRQGSGLLPAPGWDPTYDWDGTIPFDELPSAFNPPGGYVVSANHRLVDDEYPYVLSHDWVDGFRALRVENALRARAKHTVADLAALQQDLTSEAARQLVELLADLDPGLEGAPPLAVRALLHLRRWDHRLTPDSVAATIYVALRERLLRNLFGPRLGPRLGAYIGTAPSGSIAGSMYPARASGALIQLLRAADPGWLTGTGYASWEELKRASLIQAVLDLRARLGDDVDAWRWGALHQVSFDHVFARIKPLAPLFRRGPYPIGGDADTPHQASSASGDFGVCDWVPSYRQVVDLANLSASIAMHAPGQSGLPGSPHYDDFVQPWRAGRYHPMLFARQEVLANMEHLLVLRAQTR